MPTARSHGAYGHPQTEPIAAVAVDDVGPRIRRQISANRAASEAPDMQSFAVFPLSQFRIALTKSSYPKVLDILKPRGWTEADLDDIKGYLELRRQEIENFGINESTSPMDEIFYRLLLKSIEKKFMASFPALMTFNGDNALFYSIESVKTAQMQLCEDLCPERVEIFFMVITKFRPNDLDARVANVLATCSDKLIQGPSISAAEAFIALIQKFKPANGQELIRSVKERVENLQVIEILEKPIQ